MKKLLFFINLLLLIPGIFFSQSVIDPYVDHTGETLTQLIPSAYDGEFFIL